MSSSAGAQSRFDSRKGAPCAQNLTIALCLVAPLLAGKALAADTLTIGGTGSATELLRQVGAKFTAASEVKVDVIPSLGSTGAIRALADGKLDIAVSARPLKAAGDSRGSKSISGAANGLCAGNVARASAKG